VFSTPPKTIAVVQWAFSQWSRKVLKVTGFLKNSILLGSWRVVSRNKLCCMAALPEDMLWIQNSN
jgi:hypothetical protein